MSENAYNRSSIEYTIKYKKKLLQGNCYKLKGLRWKGEYESSPPSNTGSQERVITYEKSYN